MHATKLVAFIANPNPQVRLAAAENLVPYSTTEPAIFKTEQLKPIKHLKLLIRDHPVGYHGSRHQSACGEQKLIGF